MKRLIINLKNPTTAAKQIYITTNPVIPNNISANSILPVFVIFWPISIAKVITTIKVKTYIPVIVKIWPSIS